MLERWRRKTAAVLNYAMPFWVVLLAWFVLGEQLQKGPALWCCHSLSGFTLHSHALQACGGTIQQRARPIIEHELGDRHHCFEETPAERKFGSTLFYNLANAFRQPPAHFARIFHPFTTNYLVCPVHFCHDLQRHSWKCGLVALLLCFKPVCPLGWQD